METPTKVFWNFTNVLERSKTFHAAIQCQESYPTVNFGKYKAFYFFFEFFVVGETSSVLYISYLVLMI